MKKILVDGMPSNFGGIGTIVFNIIDNIKGDFVFEFIETYPFTYRDQVERRGIKINKLPPFGKNPFKYYHALKKLLKENKYDYVWVNNTSKVNVKIFEYAKKYGAKTIAHSHGNKCEGNKLVVAVLENLSKLNERKFYKNLDIACACSKKSAEYFYDEKKLSGKPVHIINNAIDVKKYAYNEAVRIAKRKELGLKDEVAIGMVGRLTPIKNPFFMLSVLSALPDGYKLYLVGEGPLLFETEQAIAQKGLENKVIMLGKRSDVNELMQAFDFLALPSFNEGMPLVAVEAQTSGVHCIVSDTLTKEMNITGNVVYAKLNDVDDWVEKITSQVGYDRCDCSSTVSENGFSIDKIAEEFAGLLQ